MMSIVDAPIEKTKVKIDPEILEKVQEEGQVIVHCSFENDQNGFTGAVGIRVWQSTFLLDNHSNHRSKLLKAVHIPYAPEWYLVYPMERKTFTLIFESLPKSCSTFTFAEIIPEPGAFIVENISRNNQDVYNITLS
jgi:hypothetical protein